MTVSIFVSSTFTDLQLHRRLVLQAISKLELESKAMESFGALPNTPKDECLCLVRSSKLYLGIFGMRYGSLDEKTGKSLTHLEYEEAISSHIPVLIYILDENSHLVLPKQVDIGNSAQKLIDLKSKLKGSHVVSFFSSPKDLAIKVTQDIVSIFARNSQASTAQVLSNFATNSVLRHPLSESRFLFLKKKISHLFKIEIPEAILRESLELALAGDNMAAGFLLSRGAPMPLDDAIDGLMGVELILKELIEASKLK